VTEQDGVLTTSSSIRNTLLPFCMSQFCQTKQRILTGCCLVQIDLERGVNIVDYSYPRRMCERFPQLSTAQIKPESNFDEQKYKR
jgi:hypothetical protein